MPCLKAFSISDMKSKGGTAVFPSTDGKIAQVTYEQIEALCGEDKSTWGAMMQCESSSAWNVYAVAVGQAIK